MDEKKDSDTLNFIEKKMTYQEIQETKFKLYWNIKDIFEYLKQVRNTLETKSSETNEYLFDGLIYL